MGLLSSNVLAAKRRLAEGHEELRRRHAQGGGGAEVSAAIRELRDAVLLNLFQAAAANLDPDRPASPDRIVLVAHGGYGRGGLAPFSDVDLMILHDRRGMAATRSLAVRFFRDVFDIGLALGHSVRTPGEAVRLARNDPQICTSLMESRLLFGDAQLLEDFAGRFDGMLRRRSLPLVGAIEKERRVERIKFGETVYLLEPNVKRTRGGLRDLQLLRWIAKARYATAELDELRAMGLLSEEDREALRQAGEYLLWLRNEIHFHAGKPGDVLDRAEQVRIAQRLGYRATTGLLPVEQFMRDHFRHTNRVSHVVERFLTRAQFRRRVGRFATVLFGHRVGDGFHVGPAYLTANARGRRRLQSDLATIVQIVDLANRYDKPIDPEVWELVRRQADRLDEKLPPEAVTRFLSLLKHPARLGSLLRLMHEARLLERFIPAFAHARGLLQFNQYHKYTVDEHSFRALDRATEFLAEEGPLGDVYRGIGRKHVLHLALLLHDLGKGYPDDHCQVGREIARQTAQRLGLDAEETGSLELLVFKHLLMNHLALRRDTHDEQVAVRLAIEVGSAELLGMLFVMTASDLAAVGPGVWDRWKAEILTDLYRRCLAQLAGESFPVNLRQRLDEKRRQVRELLADKPNRPRPDDRLDERLASLPASYLSSTPPQQVARQLQTLERLTRHEVEVEASYQPETKTILATVAAHEDITPGIFHRLTGAFSSRGLEILSAEIITLPGGLVLDRFQVVDPDYADCPPAERFDEIRRTVQASLTGVGPSSPTFRRTWQVRAAVEARPRVAQTQVRVDNGTSDDCTILDIFAADRPGLLYEIARTLFELGLSVKRAKIGTVVDQVLDVFYVTDQQGRKIEDRFRHQEIRGRLLKVILSQDEAGETR